MAGSYPDVPGRRFAYHLDGTMMVRRSASGSLVNLDSSMPNLNNHETASTLNISNEGSTTSGRYLCLIFPELRNIDGYNIYSTNNGNFTIQGVEVSSDTVDGAGGTWAQVSPSWSNDGTMSPSWREAIEPLSVSSIKAIRFRYSWTTTNNFSVDWRALHIYGSVVTGENPNRLRAWHPTLDQEVSGAYFDFADIAQGTQQTKQFRIKNDSATLTAQNITLSQDDVPGGGMGVTFSTDGTTFTSPLVIGNIAPGATSSILYVRRTVGPSETVQLRASLIKAIASSWA